MTSVKLNIVMEKIGARKRRPRDVEEWKKSLMDLFIEVWETIFPKDEFPHLKEPLSQCMCPSPPVLYLPTLS